jgi:hypothetical protein
MTTCIDLRKQFGSKYRISCEESCEQGKHGKKCDPWNAQILCQSGHIYPHSSELLGVSTNSRGPIAKRLAALTGIRVLQDGDDGINAVFSMSEFDQIAEIVKPRRKRQLSPEHRAKLSGIGTANLKKLKNTKVQSTGDEYISDLVGAFDLRVV